MTVVALQLNLAMRSTDPGSHVNFVIESNGSGIARFAQRLELRMIVFEILNNSLELRETGLHLQIAVALYALTIVHIDKAQCSFVLDVTRGAGRRELLVGLMRRSVVASETGVVSDMLLE